MHVQIVEFEIQGIGRADYERRCEQIASAFAEVAGLIDKRWIIDPESNRAGGVYLWRDRAACDAYLRSELFCALTTDPTFANLRSRHFDVLERPTGTTRGLPVLAAV